MDRFEDVVASFGYEYLNPKLKEEFRAFYLAGRREWQPIETAPKDGTSYLICDARRGFVAPVVLGVIQNNPGTTWDWQYGANATHWQPLPPPPKENE